MWLPKTEFKLIGRDFFRASFILFYFWWKSNVSSKYKVFVPEPVWLIEKLLRDRMTLVLWESSNTLLLRTKFWCGCFTLSLWGLNQEFLTFYEAKPLDRGRGRNVGTEFSVWESQHTVERRMRMQPWGVLPGKTQTSARETRLLFEHARKTADSRWGSPWGEVRMRSCLK